MANPYLQPFFDTLTQGVQVAQHLRQAALQQQELEQARRAQEAAEAQRQQEIDQRNRQLDLNSRLQQASLIESGARPVNSSGQVSVPMETPNPMAGILPGESAFTPAGTTSVAADTGRVIPVNGQSYEIPNADELRQRSLQQRLDEYNIGKAPLSEEGSRAIGGILPPGTMLDPAHLTNIGTIVRANQQPAPKYSYKDFTDDSGNVTRVVSDGQGNTVRTIQLGKLGGTKGEGGAGGRQLTPDAELSARQKALADYQRASKEEAQLNQDRLTLGTALKTGQHYVDKNGNLKRFDPTATPEEIAAQQANMRDLLAAKTKRLEQVIADKNDAMGRYGTRPQVSTQQAIAAIEGGNGKKQPPAANAGGAPKVASLANVKAYAQRKGITLDQATREFSQYGYKVQ
jgi:hypothetical protein